MKKNAIAEETAPNLLIVDDNPNNLRMLCDILMEQNWKVRPVSDGMLALQAAATNPPDLILLDVMMPGMDARCQVTSTRAYWKRSSLSDIHS